MISKSFAHFAAVLSSIAAYARAHTNTTVGTTWTLTPTNSSQQFRGLSPVSDRIIWVSGTAGTVLRSINSGLSWANVSPDFASENASSFQFRDIQAWSAKVAVVLSIGEGNASRIYRTEDGGMNWNRTFVNQEAAAFYDCMAFETDRPWHGIAMSDPVNGRFRLLETWDNGKSWKILSSDNMPAALVGEAGFAASGTCIEAVAGRWYIASGGVNPGRIFRSRDPRRGWEVSNSSIAGGATAGVFSITFRDAKYGIAVGGDFEKPRENLAVAAWSNDSGVSWHGAESSPGGYRSGASWLTGERHTAIAVGTSGSDITLDGGKNWHQIDSGAFDTVKCIGRYYCWASGPGGRVGKLILKGW